MKKIAVLLTCHNRRLKTECCLTSLVKALKENKNNEENQVEIEIFLTDDGSTDGTADAAKAAVGTAVSLNILNGNGDLYWAGGMRYCWKEAMKRHEEWDYYLLLNDDTELMPNVFRELFLAEKYAVENYSKEGVVSGITCSKANENELTYGGDIWLNKFLAKRKRLIPNGNPQLCDLTNANILLVPKNVVDNIGIFYKGYRHGKADYDYSVMAKKAGFPVVLTAHYCGYCERDHWDESIYSRKILSMSLKERKSFFANPVHSNSDYLRFIMRTSPIRLPMVWVGRMLNVYLPKLYYRLYGTRNNI